MTSNSKKYKKFKNAVENSKRSIDIRESYKNEKAETTRASLRDKIGFFKPIWWESMSYASIIRDMVIFLGLTPIMIANINTFFQFLGVDFRIPLGVGTLFVIGTAVGMVLFGWASFTHLGLFRRSSEVMTKQSPGTFLLWKKQQDLEKMLNELSHKIDELKKRPSDSN